LCANRAALFATLPRALQAAGELQHDRKRGQKSIFESLEDDDATTAADSLADVPDWHPSERLKHEKEALDFYFSSHPLAEYDAELRRFASHSIDQLRRATHGHTVLVGGMLTQVRLMNVKKARNGNTRYVRCKIEDFTGVLEAMMWPEDYAKFKDDFADDRILFAEGTVEQRGEEPQLVMTRVFNIDTARKELTKGLVLKLDLGQHRLELLDQLAKVLCKTPGPCQVYVQVTDAAGKRAVLRAGHAFNVNPADVRLGELEMLLGPGQVMFAKR
jgi:DNA polymerase-3 subunit alpha